MRQRSYFRPHVQALIGFLHDKQCGPDPLRRPNVSCVDAGRELIAKPVAGSHRVVEQHGQRAER
jgi:hypothetical protein